MSLRPWLDHNARAASRWQPEPADTVDWPQILVTEEEATEDTMRRYFAAEERKALELV